MVYNNLRKDLVDHMIYSSWQFIECTEENIRIVEYCADIINAIFNKMDMETVRWERESFSNPVDGLTEDGKIAKCLTLTTDNFPAYELRVMDDRVEPKFLFEKLLRDFFQYTMNAFDSISQIINSGLLANRSKKVDSVDFQTMKDMLNKQTYSANFPKMQAWLNKIASSQEYVYIQAVNNRTKHTAKISIKLSMGILGSPNIGEIGPFFRKEEQHNSKELSKVLQTVVDFLHASWLDFQTVFSCELKKDVYIQNRRHEISGVRQQKFKDAPDKNLSYAYIKADSTLAAMPDELYILFVREHQEDVWACDSTFNTILITAPNSNVDILGRYVAEDNIGNDCLLHYRKYRKDDSVVGKKCLIYEQGGNTDFYHSNPFFDIETITDEKEFLAVTPMPL